MGHHIHPLGHTAREWTFVDATANSGWAAQRISPGQPGRYEIVTTALKYVTLNSFSDWRSAEFCCDEAAAFTKCTLSILAKKPEANAPRTTY
jgi:hypothetical protein